MKSTEWREHVDASGGPNACWKWLGNTGADGYAVQWFSDLKRPLSVARVVLADTLTRPIAPGMWALHRCDNRMCANPQHIYEGSPADNGRDMAARGRSRNGHTKFRLGAALYDGTIGRPRGTAA